MDYVIQDFICSNKNHGVMNYEGGGDYICSVCGETYHDYHFEEVDEDESLSVYDAADIWASNGKDEDYMFGYSREELEDAL